MTIDNNILHGRLSFFPQFFTKIQDLLSSKYHSEDFKQTRRHLIIERLRILCLLFAITVPISSVFDLLSLGTEIALQLLPLRLILSLSLAVLFYACHLKRAKKYSNLLLCAAFLLPCLFFLSVELVFQKLQIPMSHALAITPFLIITMLGLFPLTLRFGVTIFTSIALLNFVFDILQLNHAASYSAQHLWQLCLFGGVAIWLQLGQLTMLMKLYRESTIDPLTGLINRRVLMRQLTFACDKINLIKPVTAYLCSI